jgi:hypothetical protein
VGRKYSGTRAAAINTTIEIRRAFRAKLLHLS